VILWGSAPPEVVVGNTIEGGSRLG